jgi:hypothetical protein
MAVDMAPEPEADQMQEEEVLACAVQSWFHLFLGRFGRFGLGFSWSFGDTKSGQLLGNGS